MAEVYRIWVHNQGLTLSSGVDPVLRRLFDALAERAIVLLVPAIVLTLCALAVAAGEPRGSPSP